MSTLLTHFAINSKDVKKSAHFYADILGFKLEYISESEDWAELGTLNGSISLAIKKMNVGEQGGASGLGFAVSDCKAITEEFKLKNIEIIKDCEYGEMWGGYLTQIKDPDGDIVWFCQKVQNK